MCYIPWYIACYITCCVQAGLLDQRWYIVCYIPWYIARYIPWYIACYITCCVQAGLLDQPDAEAANMFTASEHSGARLKIQKRSSWAEGFDSASSAPSGLQSPASGSLIYTMPTVALAWCLATLCPYDVDHKQLESSFTLHRSAFSLHRCFLPA